MKSFQLVIGLSLLGNALLADDVKPPVIVKPPHVIVQPPVVGPIVTKKTYHLHANELAQSVDSLLATAKMKLNNHQTQSSFVEIRGIQLGFQIARTSVDLDCGTFCPDLGNGYFYVNDLNLERGDFALRSGYFELSLDMEDSGREVKGYHSVLGDDGMPDFQMNRPLLKFKAMPAVSGGKLTLSFSDANLSADIQSTGGCNIAGIDICNKIFGTDRKIEKGVEASAQNALNGGTIQTALKLAIAQWLQSQNINGNIRSVNLVGSDLQVTVDL